MPEFKDKYTVIRHSSGEEIETLENLSWLFGKVNGKGDYFMVYDSNVFDDRRLTLTDLRVYFWLCKIMDPGGWILQTQAKIAHKSGIAQPNIARAISNLRKHGYLLKEVHSKSGRELLRVNPVFASKGSTAMRRSHVLSVKEDDPEYST